MDWVEANDGIWRTGSKMYKFRGRMLQEKATDLGITKAHLVGWWKSMKDQYVRLQRTKSGQAARKRVTDHEEWVLRRCAFYQRQVKADNQDGQPINRLARQGASLPSQPSPSTQQQVVSDNSDEEGPGQQRPLSSTSSHPPQVSSQASASQPSTSQGPDLGGLEEQAASEGRGLSGNYRSRRRKRDRGRSRGGWLAG